MTRVEWEEKRQWRPSDGPEENFPRGIWEKHQGNIDGYVNRLELYPSGKTFNTTLAIVHDTERNTLTEHALIGLIVVAEPVDAESLPVIDHRGGNPWDNSCVPKEVPSADDINRPAQR